MELADYLRIIRHHWVGVVLCVIGVVALTGIYNVTQKPVYAANAQGFVVAGIETDPSLASAGDTLAKSKAKSYLSVATSRVAAEAVIKELELDTTPAALIGQLSATQPVDTPWITLTARGDTPEQAQELADAWLHVVCDEVDKLEDPDGDNPRAVRVEPYEPAALPTSPVSPQVVRNLLIGLVLGLLVGFGYAMLRSQLDRRLRTAAAVERGFGVTVVGSVPKAPLLSGGNRTGDRLAVLSHSDRDQDLSAGEAFRKLRTNLQFMSVDEPPRVIVLTSPRPGDGKSTVAANLAGALAATGSPVVLVDGDLRRPTVADSFGLVEGAGLTDVLIGRVEVDDVLQQHESLEHLQILAAGGIPPNPSELLGSQAMRHMLSELSQRATVIVDAPPLLPVTDGAVLAAVADGAFVVISAGRTLDTELGAALEHLEAVHAHAFGIILNGMPAREVYSSRYYRAAAGRPAEAGASED